MKKINIKKLLENIIIILSTLIIFANANIISKYVSVILISIFILSIIYIIMFDKKNIKSKILYAFGLTIIFFIVHSLFSYNIKSSVSLVKYYIFFYTFLFVDYSEKTIYTFLNIVKKIIIFGALTIIISPIIDNFILRFFSFFVKANPIRIMAELSESTYSGIFSEKGNAAFLLNVGVAIIGSKILSNDFDSKKEKRKNILELFIIIIALILTNKRALLAFPVIIFGLIYLFIKDKNKIIKIIKVAIPTLIVFIILINTFPVMGKVFDRFVNDDDNHRSELRAICLIMNNEKPLLGYGLNTFNQYAYDIGFRLNVYGSGDTDGRWRYHAHNVFYQLLGETGYIGLIITYSTFIYYIYNTIILLRKSDNIKCKRIIVFSLYIQLLFVIYGFTGNTFYYYQQIAIYFVAINFLLTEVKLQNMKGEVNNEKNRDSNISFGT